MSYTFKEILSKHNPELSSDLCLAWGKDYEHKPYSVSDEINLGACWVWFQVKINEVKHIFKFEKKPKVVRYFFHKNPNPDFLPPPIPACDLWTLVEASEGTIEFSEDAPFHD